MTSPWVYVSVFVLAVTLISASIVGIMVLFDDMTAEQHLDDLWADEPF